jgi:AcrR family transcriptional regulator
MISNSLGTCGTGGIVLYHIKEDKRTRVTTQLICDALTSLIMEGKWDNLTITALVNKAQVGRATFYRSFDFVEDVLKLQVDQAMNDLFRFIFNQIQPLAFFYEMDLYKLFFEYWDQHDLLLKVLMKSNQRSLFKTRFRAMYFDKLRFVQHILNIHDSHWSYFVILRSAIFSDGLFEWIQKGKKENSEEISNILLLSFSELHLVKLSLRKDCEE